MYDLFKKSCIHHALYKSKRSKCLEMSIFYFIPVCVIEKLFNENFTIVNDGNICCICILFHRGFHSVSFEIENNFNYIKLKNMYIYIHNLFVYLN